MRAARDRHAAMRRGVAAENLCVLVLRLKGYAILERRLRGRRGSGVGEIDIVARKGTILAFIEVKARANEAAAAHALGWRQRARLERAALLYLARHPELGGNQPRFDVMLVRPWRWPRHLIDAWREGD